MTENARTIRPFRLRNAFTVLMMFVSATATLAQAPDATTPSDPPNTVASTDPVGTYLNAIERIETDSGSYSTDLVDLYQGLGAALVAEGDLEGAWKAYYQSAQIIRVNFGPYSPDQTDYMFSIADVEAAMGEFEHAAEIIQDAYELNAETYGEHHQNMVPVLDRIFTWYTTYRPLDSPYSGYIDLMRAGKLLGEKAEILETNLGLSDPATAQAWRHAGQVQFMTVKRAMGDGDDPDADLPYMRHDSSELGELEAVTIRHHFNAGINAFDKYRRSVLQRENSTLGERAEAIAQLADWYLIFENERTANTIYRQAWNSLLDGGGSPELAVDIFGEPAPVRFMRNSKLFDTTGDEDGETPILEVSMTVARNGELRDVELLEVPETFSEDQLREVRRRLANTRFRPRLINGRPEATEDFVWRYAF